MGFFGNYNHVSPTPRYQCSLLVCWITRPAVMRSVSDHRIAGCCFIKQNGGPTVIDFPLFVVIDKLTTISIYGKVLLIFVNALIGIRLCNTLDKLFSSRFLVILYWSTS